MDFIAHGHEFGYINPWYSHKSVDVCDKEDGRSFLLIEKKIRFDQERKSPQRIFTFVIRIKREEKKLSLKYI